MNHPNPPIAIICGSGTPVGAALAERLLADGAALVAIDFAGAPAHPRARLQLRGNLAIEQDWRGFAEQLAAHGLRPDKLAYAVSEADEPAGAADRQPGWDRVAERNVRGAFLACEHLLPHMARPGAIVLLASVLGGWDTRADLPALAASSAGVLALARALAVRAAPHVRVNTVCYPATPLPWRAEAGELQARIPLGRATTPADLADAMAFLLSDDASYLTGSELVVDGGQSLQSWSNAPE